MNQQQTVSYASEALTTNKVLKNTYALLAMTMVVSAIAAFTAIVIGLSHMMGIIMMLAGIGIVWFVIPRNINSSMGIVWTFVFTALMGGSLGPILSHYLAFPQGPSIVMQALGMTGLVFFGLSAYALSSKKDFSYMGGFLVAGCIALIVATLLNIFLNIPAFSLAISGAAVMLFSGFILFDTSRIMRGHETNYVRATVQMYMVYSFTYSTYWVS